MRLVQFVAVLSVCAACAGETGPEGPEGPPGEMGEMGTPGEMGAPGSAGGFDPTLAIANGTGLQTASFNISGSGYIGDRMRIGAAFLNAVPSSSLEVTAGALARVAIVTAGGTPDQSSTLYFDRARGSLASPASAAQGDSLFRIYARAYNGTGLQEAARIESTIDGALGTRLPGALLFWTTPASGAVPTAEAVRIASNGNVGIATAGVTPGARFQLGAAPAVASTVLSTLFRVNANGSLIAATDETSLGSFSFASDAATNALGLRAKRVADGGTASDNLSIALGFDRNNVASDGGTVWLRGNGNVGINVENPLATLDVAGGIRTQWQGSQVLQLGPAGTTEITHNLGITGQALIFVTNGDPPANMFSVIGAKASGANTFTVYTSGGTANTAARFNYVILQN